MAIKGFLLWLRGNLKTMATSTLLAEDTIISKLGEYKFNSQYSRFIMNDYLTEGCDLRDNKNYGN